MTTLTAPAAAPTRLRRTLALAGAETRLLLRNRTAVVNSVLLPLLLVAFVPVAGLGGDGPVGPRIAVAAFAVTLVFLTYYNLVTTYVARREELVLQRMRSGELTPGEVLLGTATPTLLVTVAQVLLVLAGTAVIGEWSAPADVVLPLVALVGGMVLMTLLAAASTSFTRTAESAQITTLPLVVLASVTSGVVVPLASFPDQVAQAMRLTPIEPIVELARLGLVGQTWDGRSVDWAGAWAAAPQPLLVLAAWIAVAAVVAPRVFRWAPRR
ncbi:ABC-2 type transport system permease protein [Geodermatophilus amargosae]|uniref:ABC-2 type transport system permease protein n=1 Tax=Geodermatophilus amargosae TaxID=1296565 RepID=A0A1I6ZH23_9ACTN|nr:ABC transporter permease [Geodermatophilus amargosae]SFT62026.1 ABC-2 type transport system permease protein [Geodermatophilus amargosae]